MSKLKFIVPVVALLLVACPDDESLNGDSGDQPDLAELCAVNCDTIELCYGLQSGETLDDCIDQCVEWRQEDLDRMGTTCDALLFELLECQYNLSCDDYIEYHEEGPGPDHPCVEKFEEYHFTEDCMSGAS